MKFRVGYVYLERQFAHPEKYFRAIGRVVARGDFTLGKELGEFEEMFSEFIGVKHAVGVGSGTDAIYLTLKALGIGSGDEVITAPNSFIATAAAIALAGARPVFVDVRDDYTIDPTLIEAAITTNTRAIIPVHLTGNPADMAPINALAKKHNLLILEDAAQAVGTQYDERLVGTFGVAAAFSMHPLKILNIWGDGGVVTTNDNALAKALRLWRNHGLEDREDALFFGHNSRLDAIQAAVAQVGLKEVESVIARRRKNAEIYKKQLLSLEPNVHFPDISLSTRATRPTFTTQVIQVKQRERLISYLTKKKIEVVVQYRVPIHLKRAARYLGYRKGDFPVCEAQARTILTIPNHQYMRDRDVIYVCHAIKEFYGSRS